MGLASVPASAAYGHSDLRFLVVGDFAVQTALQSLRSIPGRGGAQADDYVRHSHPRGTALKTSQRFLVLAFAF
jgi:hypothetical protein